MNWYYAKDGQQVGPVDESELPQLVGTGAILGTTLVWREGLQKWQPYQEVWVAGMPDWRSAAAPFLSVPPLTSTVPPPDGQAACSECRRLFPTDQLISIAGRSICAACKPVIMQRLQEGVSSPGGTGGRSTAVDPETLVRCSAAKVDRLDVMACLSRSWHLLKREPLLAIGSVAITFFLMMAGGMIPILSFCIGLLVNTPLMGGLWSLFLKALRGEAVSLEEVFSGFSKRWVPLVLAGLLQLLITAVAIGPVAGIVAFWVHAHPGLFPAGLELLMLSLMGAVALLLSIYLSLAFFFSVPLMMDYGYGVIDALNVSRRIVNRNFFAVFLLALMSLVLMLGGTLAICLGLVVAIPVIIGMWAAAYEELFGSRVPLI